MSAAVQGHNGSTYHHRLHIWPDQDHPIKPRQLEDSQPGIDGRRMDIRELNHAGSHSKDQIQHILAVQEKFSPVWQRGENPQQDLHVKGECDPQLAIVKKGLLPAAHFRRSRSLEHGGGEGEEDPAPFGITDNRIGPIPFGNASTHLGVPVVLFVRYIRCKPRQADVSSNKGTTKRSLRSSTKRAFHRHGPDGLKRVDDDGHKKVQQPKVQDDDTNDEEDA